MLTNRLNQDCLEKKISVVRRRRGHNPDPHCQADIDKVLLDISSFSQVSTPSEIRGTTLSDENVSVSADDSSAISTLNICTQLWPVT